MATTTEREMATEVRDTRWRRGSWRPWALVLGSAMLGAATLSTTGARGGDCSPDSQATAVERADVVAAARVVDLGAPADGQRRMKLQVQRLFKGESDWQIEVSVSGSDGGDIFEVGQSYLVFAKRDGAVLRIGACSGTLLAVEAGGIIDGLGAGHKPHAGPQEAGAGGAAAAVEEPPPAAHAGVGATPPATAGGCAACSLQRAGATQGWWLLLALAGVTVGRRRRRRALEPAGAR